MPYTGSKAQAGRGSVVSIGGVTGVGGTETWSVIGEVKTAGPKGAKWDTDDVSNFQSGVSKEFLATMLDNGSCDIAGNRIGTDAGQIAVEAAFASGLTYDFKIQLPINVKEGQTTTGDLFAFSALVESRDIPVDLTKAIGWNVTLKISGQPTIAPGS